MTGSQVAGPNVFVDCYSTDTYSDIGPHHRYATGLLFDNVYGGQIQVQNRKDMGTGHGWAGAQTLFWNCTTYKNNIRVESPIGAMNWGIGCVAPVLDGNGTGYWESRGTRVVPRSLYYKQLEDRVGSEAANKAMIPEQRAGSIWSLLAAWRGIGNLSSLTDVEKGETTPRTFSLSQNYPNPFNPATTIEFSLSRNEHAILRVFNLLGQKIATLIDDLKPAGVHTITWDASHLPSGIYVYRLQAASFADAKKMVRVN